MMNAGTTQAIDARVTFDDGSEGALSDLWSNQPLVLVFLRHLG